MGRKQPETTQEAYLFLLSVEMHLLTQWMRAFRGTPTSPPQPSRVGALNEALQIVEHCIRDVAIERAAPTPPPGWKN